MLTFNFWEILIMSAQIVCHSVIKPICFAISTSHSSSNHLTPIFAQNIILIRSSPCSAAAAALISNVNMFQLAWYARLDGVVVVVLVLLAESTFSSRSIMFMRRGGSRSTISTRSISISVSARLHFCREWVEQCVDNVFTPVGGNLLGKWDFYMKFLNTFFLLDLFANLTFFFMIFSLFNYEFWPIYCKIYYQLVTTNSKWHCACWLWLIKIETIVKSELRNPALAGMSSKWGTFTPGVASTPGSLWHSINPGTQQWRCMTTELPTTRWLTFVWWGCGWIHSRGLALHITSMLGEVHSVFVLISEY